jgi:hypothetical protein
MNPCAAFFLKSGLISFHAVDGAEIVLTIHLLWSGDQHFHLLAWSNLSHKSATGVCPDSSFSLIFPSVCLVYFSCAAKRNCFVSLLFGEGWGSFVLVALRSRLFIVVVVAVYVSLCRTSRK